MTKTGPLVEGVGVATRLADGTVAFVGGPWTVRVRLGDDCGRPYIRRLTVDVRNPRPRVTAARLARLPLAHLLHAAAAQVAEAEGTYPNEALYRLLAVPKPAGQRAWDDGHYRRVAQVAAWAREVRRPGGPTKAVADLWGVVANPTAYRWLAEARRRASNRGDGSMNPA